ncbi:MAG: hypothetical protein WKG01_09840 [Kofleriaceae bacterium]
MRGTWLFLFVLGCGSVTSNPPDGAVGDATPDGPSVGEATLEVKLGGVATSGLNVVFQDTLGAVVTEATTDASGKATATVHVGAMITVAVSANELITITGVKPGETILLKNPPPYDGTSVGQVTFSATQEANNKSFYRADLGDDQYFTLQTMTSGARTMNLLRGNIDAAGKFSMVVAVYDASDKIISYASSSNLTPTIGGTTAVSFPSLYRSDVTELNVTLTGAPADASLLAVDSANEQAGMLFAPSSFAGLDQSSVAGGNAAVIVPYLGSFGDFVQTTATLRFMTPGTETFTWARRVPRPAGAFVIDAAATPRLGSAMLDTATPTRPVASWTITGNAAAGDANIARLTWRDAGGGSFTWHAYVAPDATTFTFPVVSTALAPQAPSQTSIFTTVGATHHNLEPLAGFDAFRLAPPVDFEQPSVLPLGFISWTASQTRKTL